MSSLILILVLWSILVNYVTSIKETVCPYAADCICGSAGFCQENVGLGSTCSALNYCSDTHAECDGICVCSAGYYDSNGDLTGGTCVAKIGLGYPCSMSQYCYDSNAVCSGNCVCSTGYYDNNGVTLDGACEIKLGLGSPCSMSDSCYDSNAVCSGNCVCSTGYYDNNGATIGGNCVIKNGLGSACSMTESCSDINAVCSVTCVCLTGYYDSNGGAIGGTCLTKVNLGARCPRSDACGTPNGYCGISPLNVSSTCVCNEGYYDTNGLLANGECKDVTLLRVTSVSYVTITENSMSISWNGSGNQAYVDYYLVEHRHINNNTPVYSQNVGRNTSSTIIGLDPGKKYSITIISVSNETASSIRFTSVTSSQITKPSRAGPFLNTQDLDASSGNITLQWRSSDGEVTGYGGYLKNTTLFSFNKEFNTSGTVLNQTFSGVKSGALYTCIIQAVSGYSDTSVLYSDINTVTIKTRVQVPEPPSNITCSDFSEQSLYLSWKATNVPNGDILYYKITVNKMYPRPETVYNISTLSADTTITVNNLSEGSFYSFKIYTVNEMYQSNDAAILHSCQTKALLAGTPKDLSVFNLTSRFGTVHWNKPSKLSGVHYGYILKIHNIANCSREVHLKCKDCPGIFPSLTSSVCSETFELFVNSSELLGLQIYEAYNLLPDTSYIVSVSAITGIGEGQAALTYLHTSEEAPQKPYDVKIEMITATSANVVWKMDGPRPGDTNYAIIAKGNDPLGRKAYSVNGYYYRSFNMTSLEEFWNYSVTIEAETSIGRNTSDSISFQTSMGTPGKVLDFYVEKGSGAYIYRTARIAWKMPAILERNGPIHGFSVRQDENYEGNFIQINYTDVLAKSDVSYTYTIVFRVLPETIYKFTIRAVNEHTFPGRENTIDYLAPAGPPFNSEEKGINVIIPSNVSAHTHQSFLVEIDVDFFMDQNNGQIQTRGLICCKDPICKDGNSSIMMMSDIENMMTYAKAKLSGSHIYRLPLLKFNATATQKGSRRILYYVGAESCENRTVDEYCNGPLESNSQYSIIAYVCTSGGCTLSRSYGPFATLPDNVIKTVGPNLNSEQTIIIASTICGTLVLLALIIITVKARKTWATKRESHPNPSENYTDIALTTPANIYEVMQYPVYDNTRIN